MTMNMKLCKRCNVEKGTENFTRINKKYKDKKGLEKKYYYLFTYCKDCVKKLSVDFRKNNVEQQLLSGVKSSAKKRGLSFDLELQDIVIPDYCPILNIKLESSVGNGWRSNAPSVDRIDNKLGYTKNNIMIVSNLANSMKRDADLETLLLFCENILKLYKKS